MRWQILIVFVAQCLQATLTAKILAVCAVASHSHSLWCYKYMAALAEKGHEITVFGVDSPKIEIAKLKTFIVEGVYESVLNQELTDEWKDKTTTDSEIGSMYTFQVWAESSTKVIMRSKALKELINEYRDFEKPFDLIIFDNGNVEALLALVPLFGNPPLLLATTYGSPQWMTSRVGNILNPAYVPNMISSFNQHMSFYERCINAFYYLFVEWFVKIKFEPFQEQMKTEVFGKNVPQIRDLARRANLVIVNYHPALNEPRPLLPGVIGIAGLHISDPKPLPQDIKDFMDGAEHGVILLSFGTNIDSNWFDKEFEDTVIEALGQFPQRVLWKWEKAPAKLPPNVKISKWLPQADILVHPKMSLFITHCGLLSTQEAIFRKVPVLALPVFLDQQSNAAMLVRRNLTIQLDVYKLTTATLRDGIKEILSNPMYKRNIETLGELLQDMPLTAKQQAVFWTEYVIRHKGAHHLRSAAADMPWYQLLLLDVIGSFLFVVFIVMYIINTSLSFLVRKLLFKKIKTKCD